MRVEILDITKVASRVRARLVFAVLTIGTLAIALSPATAGAQQVSDSTDAQYNSTLTQITAGGPDEPGPTATASSEGSLPFTGLDLAAMAIVAGGLGVAGFAMRRRLASSGDHTTS